MPAAEKEENVCELTITFNQGKWPCMKECVF